MKAFWNIFREPVNSLTHWAGALKALIFLGVSLYLTGKAGINPTAFIIFGVCTCLLYIASASYHSFKVSEKTMLWLRKLDHSAIFLMMAGTYTPILLLGVHGPLQWILMVLVWVLAVAGIGMKMFTMKMPRWISTLLYMGMGWLAVLLIPELLKLHSPQVLLWLLIGGLIYTVGGIIYGTKKINLVPGVFGFHELWHLFVLGGSTAHSIMVIHLIPHVI